jgi:hypothetical protein
VWKNKEAGDAVGKPEGKLEFLSSPVKNLAAISRSLIETMNYTDRPNF